jgi:hypothetical protein
MPLFDAGAVVEALDYDFRKAGVKAYGTIPEPTDMMIGEFLKDLRDLVKQAEGVADMEEVDQTDPAAMLQALNSLNPDKFVEMLAATSAAYGKLCQERPTADEIQKLPLRVRRHFFDWLQKEVISPEAEPAAGSGQVINLPRAAGGSSST